MSLECRCLGLCTDKVLHDFVRLNNKDDFALVCDSKAYEIELLLVV